MEFWGFFKHFEKKKSQFFGVPTGVKVGG